MSREAMVAHEGWNHFDLLGQRYSITEERPSNCGPLPRRGPATPTEIVHLYYENGGYYGCYLAVCELGREEAGLLFAARSLFESCPDARLVPRGEYEEYCARVDAELFGEEER